ncbi:TnsA endonuclease N-terminal domain-containing protein [Paenibacillus alginolyticus]|uniref:TnsA endonuclease N-terminal domain-containing protein n=1 Tax=Paenibacillus alginolyticus TaxID=59839 RepID=A0ABT4GN01_9BACL|nr:TnsA endonuclease N-terminal domain-containing protein [Paenibacillus alginolyticus]MCY9697590.1 TnsA endonuclease N-terminal domain-containing protein [Paenibacillus alginolyticus]MEC0143342.1 TnsA endonuclease N-terminal domain-containing protein [Paenibacillus alginolyticus]
MSGNSTIQSLIKRWIKEGKGQGSGENYKPWFTAKQVSSRGTTHRPKGIKTGREHLFLSDWEYFYFLLSDWSDIVSDIREQFPLLDEHNDIEETVEIAKQLGVEHPIEPTKNTLKVMTTDFLITFFDGTEVAVSFKPFKLVTEREVEKMEIERIYWERRGIQWELVSDKDIPLAYAKNIDYTHSVHDLSDYHISQVTVAKVKRLMEPLIIKRNSKLTEITNEIDDRLGLEPGNSLTIARHLIITKKWVVNMEELIEPNKPLPILQIPVEKMEVQRKHAN